MCSKDWQSPIKDSVHFEHHTQLGLSTVAAVRSGSSPILSHHAMLLPRVRLTPVIGMMPEGLHPRVIFYPHTRCGNLCLEKTVALKFLDSHPGEGIKTNHGLYPKCPSVLSHCATVWGRQRVSYRGGALGGTLNDVWAQCVNPVQSE
jgi:hypothetical protein